MFAFGVCAHPDLGRGEICGPCSIWSPYFGEPHEFIFETKYSPTSLIWHVWETRKTLYYRGVTYLII